MSTQLTPVQFERDYPIRFSHCDPAGIVFFPQYFVLFNQLVEDWFNAALDIPYADMLQTRRIGLPTVHLDCDFAAISRMGEVLQFGLSVQRAGTKSLRLALQARHARELRVQATQVMVFTNLDTHAAIDMPMHVRRALPENDSQ